MVVAEWVGGWIGGCMDGQLYTTHRGTPVYTSCGFSQFKKGIIERQKRDPVLLRVRPR